MLRSLVSGLLICVYKLVVSNVSDVGCYELFFLPFFSFGKLIGIGAPVDGASGLLFAKEKQKPQNKHTLVTARHPESTQDPTKKKRKSQCVYSSSSSPTHPARGSDPGRRARKRGQTRGSGCVGGWIVEPGRREGKGREGRVCRGGGGVVVLGKSWRTSPPKERKNVLFSFLLGSRPISLVLHGVCWHTLIEHHHEDKRWHHPPCHSGVLMDDNHGLGENPSQGDVSVLSFHLFTSTLV